MPEIETNQRPLWAPWRIEFIRSQKNGECFLCNNKEKSGSPDEELIIYRGEFNFVILNRFPYNSGHLMIAPYRHIADLSALEQNELHEIMDLMVRIQKTLQKAMSPEGINAGINLGAAAGAGVKDHLHFHMVPRWVGDANFMPVIGDIRVVPESLANTAKLLKKSWK